MAYVIASCVEAGLWVLRSPATTGTLAPYVRSMKCTSASCAVAALLLGCGSGASQGRSEPETVEPRAETEPEADPQPAAAVTAEETGEAQPDATTRAGACQRIARAHQAVIEAMEHPPGNASLVGQCVNGDSGAWALVMGPAPDDWESDLLEVQLTLVYVDDQGDTHEGDEATTFMTQQQPPTERDDGYGNDYDFISIQQLADFDGDGTPEVVLSHQGGDHHVAQDNLGIYTMRDGAPTPYPGLDDIGFDGFDDIDGDGRPDLTVETWYGTDPSCADGDYVYATGVSGVYHTGPDGRFRSDDAEATAWWRRQCPRAPRRLVVSQPEDRAAIRDDQVIANIVCARLWGASPDDVVARLRTEWQRVERARTTSGNTGCWELRTLERFATEIEPVVDLRRRATE